MGLNDAANKGSLFFELMALVACYSLEAVDQLCCFIYYWQLGVHYL
jgi:hypothetical protein